jgi:hypothetical protein
MLVILDFWSDQTTQGQHNDHLCTYSVQTNQWFQNKILKSHKLSNIPQKNKNQHKKQRKCTILVKKIHQIIKDMIK